MRHRALPVGGSFIARLIITPIIAEKNQVALSTTKREGEVVNSLFFLLLALLSRSLVATTRPTDTDFTILIDIDALTVR